MLNLLAKDWWALALRGIFAILLGIAVILTPGVALTTLVLLVAAYLVADGVFAVIAALQNREESNWWVHLLEGIVSIVAGIFAAIYQGMTALVILYIVAFWAIITGVFELWASFELRKKIDNEWLMGLSGLASIVFGILLILFPGEGIFTIMWLVALYAIVFGILLLALAFRLRGHQEELPTDQRTPKAA